MKLKFALLPLCLIVLNAFGFEGAVKQTITNFNGTGTNVNITWYISPKGCRLDMSASSKDLKGSNTVMLIDPVAKVFKSYEASGSGEKYYFQANASQITGTATSVAVTQTSEKKKIQGYNCEKWVVVAPNGSYDVWISRDIDFDAPLYKDFFKSSLEVQALAQQNVRGFALLTETHNGQNAATADKVTPQVFPAGTFDIPAGYKTYDEKSGPAVTK